MNIYLWMALVGLIAKIWASIRLRHHWKKPGANIFFTFIPAAFGQTVFEILNYLFSGAPHIDTIMDGYYVSVTGILICLPFVTCSILNKRVPFYLTVCSITFFAAMAYAIVFTDLIIEGYYLLHYCMTRIPGPHYWIFQSLVIFVLLFCLVLPIAEYRKTAHYIIKVKCSNLIVGFVPIVLVIIPIIFLMQFGFKINAAGIAPLLLSLYIVVLAENLRENKMEDLRCHIPGTRQYKRLQEINRPFRVVDLSPQNLSEEYKKHIMKLAEERFMKQKDAAAWLKLTESTYSRRLKKIKKQP